MRTFRRAAAAALLGAAVLAGAADPAAANLSMRLLGRLQYADDCSGLWGYSAPDGTELAIVGTLRGTSFVDVTDPVQPREVAFLPGNTSGWREARTWSHYAYIVTEGTGVAAGMQIVDLSRPLQPRLVQHWDDTFTTAHTIAIHDGWAYVNGSRRDGSQSGMRILDLANPAAPRDVGAYTTRYVHDSFVHGDTGYLCVIGVGLAIVDLADRSRPRELSFTAYPEAGTHNAAMARDGRTLYTTDERLAGRLRIWSVFDPRDPFQDGDWSAHPTTSIHNVLVHGDSAYISYYTEGVMVLDIAAPRAPRLVASFDTYPGVSGGYNGCWGVYVSPRTGYVLASDIQGGLFVLALEPRVAVTLERFALAADGGTVRLEWALQRDAGDGGRLRIDRAAGDGDPAGAVFAMRARLPLASGVFADTAVVPDGAYQYRLVHESDTGDRVLATGAVRAGAPATSGLVHAFPDPSAGPVSFAFDLARPGAVRVQVWDARGRLVRALAAPWLGAGRHRLVWDGRDARGTEPPAGVYFYRIGSGAWRASGRLTRTAP